MCCYGNRSGHVLLLFAFSLLAQVSTTFGVTTSSQQKNYPPTFADAEEHVYKKVGDIELKTWVFKPKGHRAEQIKPAIVFFFGGGWRSGSPKQFEQHCRYLAKRGMIAVTADYRVASRHKSKAVDSFADAQDAIRWLREESATLGIDPQRIVAAGGSAGGHLAACCGVMPAGLNRKRAATSISARPNMLVLFNPAVVLAPVAGETKLTFPAGKLKELEDRLGVETEKLSPYHNLPAKTGPCLIFHGKSDKTVPYRSVEVFRDAMQKSGNEVRLVGYEGQGHGFFNYGRDGNRAYESTIKELDAFLCKHKYLDAVAP